jgi:hypothetical protein
MRARFALLAAGLTALLAASVAHAALPIPGAQYLVHDHQTPGDNWHVDVKAAKSGQKLSGLVFHSEKCGGWTPYARGVPVADDGSVIVNGPLDPQKPERGSWGFQATFTTTKRLDGQFRLVTPDCDSGPMPFSAVNGDGHSNHTHPRTATSGTPIGSLPDLSKAKGLRKRELIRIYRNSKQAAREVFPTYQAALRAGYVRYKSANKRPQLFHLRHDGYAHDDIWFDARRVESLVYYRPSVGDPILVAFMFRAPLGKQPRFGKPVLGWHAHGTNKKRLETQMTHVWLTRRLRTALANCLPKDALERDIPRFRLEPGTRGLGHESSPCPDAT